MTTMPLAVWPGSMSWRTVAGQLLRPDELGHGLAQLLERRDVEQPHGEVRFEAAHDAAGQRVRVHVRRSGPA